MDLKNQKLYVYFHTLEYKTNLRSHNALQVKKPKATAEALQKHAASSQSRLDSILEMKPIM